MQLDAIGDAAVTVEHHRPGELGDLASAQAGFDRQRIMIRSRSA
jgi:hypothetical protein